MWDKAYAPNWNPSNSFSAAADAYFTVCQSTQLIETREILEALQHHIPAAICDRLRASLDAA